MFTASVTKYQNGIKFGKLCVKLAGTRILQPELSAALVIKIYELIQTPWYISASASEFNTIFFHDPCLEIIIMMWILSTNCFGPGIDVSSF